MKIHPAFGASWLFFAIWFWITFIIFAGGWSAEAQCERTYNVYDCAMDKHYYPVIDGEIVYTQGVKPLEQ